MTTATRWWTAAALFGLLAGMILSPLIPAPAEAAGETLQELIDRAQPGATIVVSPGTYQGPLTISKPLVLKAERAGTVTLVNPGEQSALRITAAGVTVSGLQIVDEAGKQAPTVLVEGERVVLEALRVRTRSIGIAMRNASDGEAKNNTVEWAGGEAVPLNSRGNGIDLYESHRVRLLDNTIRAVHDGIYLENSDDVAVIGNRIESSRYGVHCMYTNRTVIRHNTGLMNVTGAMIMTSRDTEVSGNRFAKQSENVNAQGILLFDAHGTSVTDNVVEGNRVALYVERSANNRIERNQVMYNFIGVQLFQAEQNVIRGNQFVGNVVDAQAQDSTDNELSGNFWDAFRGLDADGDGTSEIGYAINPFFHGLTLKRPAFQLFFQSPGIAFLENLYQSERHLWTTDRAPLMAPPASSRADKDGSEAIGTGLAGLLLLGCASCVIIMARRRIA